jgi:hypothetical protein
MDFREDVEADDDVDVSGTTTCCCACEALFSGVME